MPKRTRRGNTEGTITRRTDGLYHGKIRIGTKRINRYGQTRADVTRKLQTLRAELYTTGTPVAGPHVTIARLIDDYLKTKSASLLPHTLNLYRGQLERHAIPFIGHFRARSIAGPDLNQFFTDLRDKHDRSSATVRNVRKRLSSVFKTAVANGHVGANPVTLTAGVTHHSKKGTPYSADQVRALLDAAADHPLRSMITVRIFFGLRAAEICGMTWSRVDLDAGELTVDQQLKTEKRSDERHAVRFQLAKLKTRNSNRIVALPDLVVDILKTRRQEQNEAQLRAGRDWNESIPDLVFTANEPRRQGPPRPAGRPIRREYLKGDFSNSPPPQPATVPTRSCTATTSTAYLRIFRTEQDTEKDRRVKSCPRYPFHKLIDQIALPTISRTVRP